MKKAATLLVLLIFTLPLWALLPVTNDPELIISDINRISKLFPRTEGSEGESELLDYIRSRLSDREIRFSETDFQNAAGYHSFSRILQVDIPGDKPDTLIIAVPLDSRHAAGPEGSTGALNIALALSLVTELRDYTPPVSIKVLFLGAQEGLTGEAFLGSRRFLADFFPDYPVAVLYLDIPDTGGRLDLRIGGRGVISPRWLIQRTTRALNRTALPYQVASDEARFFRLGFASEATPIEPFLEAGYPALLLEGRTDSPAGDLRNWTRSFFFFISNFLDTNQEGFPSGGESHYQFFRWGGDTYLIPEARYMAFLILVPAALLIYPFFARRRFSRYLRLMGRHVWMVPVVVGLVFLFLLLGTLVLESVLRIQNTPDLWMDRPVSFFLLKITGALTLFWVTHKLLKFLPFSRRGNFYSASALVLLLLVLFLVSAINVSFSYLFLWSFVFGFLFTVFRSRFLKSLFLLASMSWMFAFLVSVFSQPQTELARLLLLSRFRGNALMALILVPYIFLFIRLSFLFFIPRKRVRKWTDRGILAVLGILTAGLLLQLFLSRPYPPDRTFPLELLDETAGDPPVRTLTLTAPAPFGTDTLSLEGLELEVAPSARTAVFHPEESLPEPSISLEVIPFLARREIRLTLSGGGDVPPPDEVRLVLSGGNREDLVVLDSNFPYTLEAGSVTFHVGIHPPLPLVMDFILPGGFPLQAELTLRYLSGPDAFSQAGRNFLLSAERRFSRILTIPGEES